MAGIKFAIQQHQSTQSKSSRSNDSSQDEQTEILQEISLACGVAVEILNDFLMFDKLEQDTLALNKQQVGVIDFMTNAIKMIFVQIREKKIHLTLINNLSNDCNDSSEFFKLYQDQTDDVSLPNKLISDKVYDDRPYIQPTDTVLIDKHKIDQVIRNLLSNAIKFTPAGGNITVTIRFESSTLFNSFCTHLTGMLVISVADNGVGMSEIDQKRLFKEVVQFRPHELQAGGGSGLGLMITKGIVDLHGGTIEVYSAGEGRGSVFTLKIPMIRQNFHPIREADCDDNHSSFVIGDQSENSYIKTTSNKGLNLFDGRFIRKQSQDILLQRFSQYEDLLAQEKNSYPIQYTPLSKSTSAKAQGNNISKYNSTKTDIIRNKSISNMESNVATITSEKRHYMKLRNVSIKNDSTFIKQQYKGTRLDGSTTLKLLLVDDSGMSRKMMCRMLRSEGHLVDEAEDGEKAVEAYQINPTYDAILMDSHMPNMNGPEATSVIRSLGFPGVILGITGDTAAKDLDIFLRQGASRVLVKPVDLDIIVETFKEFHLLGTRLS